MCMTVQGVGNGGSKCRLTSPSRIRTGSSKRDVHGGAVRKAAGRKTAICGVLSVKSDWCPQRHEKNNVWKAIGGGTVWLDTIGRLPRESYTSYQLGNVPSG